MQSRTETEIAHARMALISGLVSLRREFDLDHDTMAERMDVNTVDIAEFERLDADPTLDFLARYTRALGMRLELSVVPGSEQIMEQAKRALLPKPVAPSAPHPEQMTTIEEAHP